jgi:hypothetical protein
VSNQDNVCPNCSAPLNGPYCPACGQRQTDLDRPFREIASEAMEAFFSFDERLIRTLWPLITKPGLLTVEYLSGRRARYLHPFKLYFAFSVALFLLYSLSGITIVRVADENDAVVAIRVEESEQEDVDGTSATAPGDPGFVGRMLEPVIKLAEEDPDRLNRVFTDRLAKSIILLVPVFAVLLRLLYRKSRYIAHLVFSLHLHSFAFFALLIGAGGDLAIGSTDGNGPGNNLATIVTAVYSFLALRRVYGRGRIATVVTMIGLLIGYLVALLVTMILTLALAVATA